MKNDNTEIYDFTEVCKNILSMVDSFDASHSICKNKAIDSLLQKLYNLAEEGIDLFKVNEEVSKSG